MNFDELLSYRQLMSATVLDINVAHCAATGLAVDLYILDHCEFEIEDINRVIDVLNVFTQTSEIVFNHDSYWFESQGVDAIEMKLLRLFQALREDHFCANEFFEDEEFIGFRDNDALLKARKVGDNK